MKKPVWIDEADCLAFHGEILAHFGGLPGIRDRGLLDSALHRPFQLSAYSQPTLFDLAAAYAAGIIQNHPFMDGNKRAGFMVAAVFLEVNGFRLVASEEDVVLKTFALAAGEIGEREYAAWLKAPCVSRRARARK